MSALSARRRIESLNSGFCRFNVDVLQQFQQDHGAGQWSVREEHEVSRKDQYCQARDRRLTMGGPAAPAYTGAGRKGQLRNELYECRGVTNCERLCQFAGRTAVKSLRRATLYQDMPYSEGAGILEVGGQCGDIIAHLCEFVKRERGFRSHSFRRYALRRAPTRGAPTNCLLFPAKKPASSWTYGICEAHYDLHSQEGWSFLGSPESGSELDVYAVSKRGCGQEALDTGGLSTVSGCTQM